MLQEYQHQTDSDFIDFLKASKGADAPTCTVLSSSHHAVNDFYTAAGLLQYGIDLLLKNDTVLRHKTTPVFDVLATRFAEDVLDYMPCGSNRIHLDEFKTWLIIQLDDLGETDTIIQPAASYPVSIIPKIKSLSLNDPDNEIAFHHAGFICYREEPCIPPFFNIGQQLWPYRQVSMDWITTSEAFFTLAANILHSYRADQTTDCVAEPDKPPTFRVCASFVNHFIDPMPYHGGHIPLQEIALWLETDGGL